MSASRSSLWAELRERRLVAGEAPGEPSHTPWYVRIMLGIVGWFGSLCVLGALGLLLFLALSESLAFGLGVGAALCAAAAGLARSYGGNDFCAQSAFALSLAGQGLVLVALTVHFDPSQSELALAALVLAVLMAAAVPVFLHRVWCALTAALALIFLGDGWWRVWPPAPLVLTALLAWLWLTEFQWARLAGLKRAAGYGIMLALLAAMTSERWLASGAGTVPPPGWLLRAGYGLLLLAAVALLLRREGVAVDGAGGRLALILSVPPALASCFAPGLAPFLLGLLFGFANGDRVLTGLAVGALLLYLGNYYYWLELSLLHKSLLLMALGAALLAARYALRTLWPVSEARNHA